MQIQNAVFRNTNNELRLSPDNALLRGELRVYDIEEAVIAAGSVSMSISVGRYPVHLSNWSISSSGTLTGIDLHEGVTLTGGTPIGGFNPNRLGDSLKDFQVADDATFTGGTLISSTTKIGSRGSVDVLDDAGGMILKPNTDYIVELINDDNQTATLFLDLTMHEMQGFA